MIISQKGGKGVKKYIFIINTIEIILNLISKVAEKILNKKTDSLENLIINSNLYF